MNKKYPQYIVLMLFLLVCKQSFSTDYKNSMVEIVKDTMLFNWFYSKFNRDVPKATEDWARQELKDSGIKNFETVPLKIAPKGMDWHVRCNRIYIPETFDLGQLSDKERTYAAHVLKHEMKHYNNRDHFKRALLISVTINLGYYLAMKSPYWISAIIPLGVAANLAYIRYQEEGAERFAFEHAKDREEISVIQEQYEDWSLSIGEALYNGISLTNSKIRNNLISLLMPLLVKFVKQLDSCEADDEMKNKLENRIRTIVKMADLIRDPQHPSSLYHQKMAQEYLDKWDKQHSDIRSALALGQ